MCSDIAPFSFHCSCTCLYLFVIVAVTYHPHVYSSVASERRSIDSTPVRPPPITTDSRSFLPVHFCTLDQTTLHLVCLAPVKTSILRSAPVTNNVL